MESNNLAEILDNAFSPDRVFVTFGAFLIVFTFWAIMDYLMLLSRKKRLTKKEIANEKVSILYNNYKWFFVVLLVYIIHQCS